MDETKKTAIALIVWMLAAAAGAGIYAFIASEGWPLAFIATMLVGALIIGIGEALRR